MSPEEAHIVSKQIEALKAIGENLSSATPSSPDQENKRKVWLNQVSSVVKKYFAGNPALASQAEHIPDVASGLDLLNTVSDYVFIDTVPTASEALRTLIEQTLSDRYFKSWEVRLLGAAFVLVTVVYLGGTVWLGWQVQGVTTQADAARRSIESARDQTINAGTDLVRRIQDDAQKKAQDQIDELTKSIKSSSAVMDNLSREIAGKTDTLDKQFEQGRKDVKSAIQRAAEESDKLIRNAQADTEKKAQGQIDDLNRSIKTASGAIDNLHHDTADKTDALNKQYTQGQNDIKSAIDRAVTGAPESVNSYLSSKTAKIDDTIDKGVADKIRTASEQIDQRIKTVADMQYNFEKSLPVAAEAAMHRVKEFNDALDRYSGPIDGILSRLSTKEKITRIDAIAGTLVNASLLLWATCALSALAIIPWLIWFLYLLVRSLRGSRKPDTAAAPSGRT